MIAALTAALLLPGFAPYKSGPNGGVVLQGRMPGGAREGLVYLPPSFSALRRYPVVYLLHGLPGVPSEYIDGTNFVTWADESISKGVVQPFIAVIPSAGTSDRYNGEWAGRWEQTLLADVSWADSSLPTIQAARGRVIAGLSAGGFGAANIGLRHPGEFGTIESWSGYFQPLRDAPFTHAPRSVLDANDPLLLAPKVAPELRRGGTRFFLSTGPAHSHLFTPAQTDRFAQSLAARGVRVALRHLAQRHGMWSAQIDAGLAWAFAPA